MLKNFSTASIKNCYRHRLATTLPTATTITTHRYQSTLVETHQKMKKLLDDAAIGKYGSRSTLQMMLQLRKELKLNNIQPEPLTYEYLLSAYAKADDTPKIFYLLKEMKSKSMKPSRTFYYKAMQLAARTGNADAQARLLDEMEQHGILKTTQIYRIMLTCMANNLELERALDTVDEMKKKNIKLSATMYADLIDLAVHLNHPDLALEFLQEADNIPEFIKQKQPFFNMYVLRCAVLSGDYQTIKTCWNRITKDTILQLCSPDEGVCLGVLNVAGKSGDAYLASDVIRVIGLLGFNYRALHFAPLLEAFTLAGEIDKAFEIFSIMRNVGVVPNRQLVAPVVRSIGQDANSALRAKECLDHRKDEGREVDVVAFNLVLHVLAYNRLYEDTYLMFERHDEYKVKPDTETLDAMLDACIHMKDLKKGKKVYNRLTGTGIKPTSTTFSKMVTLACTQEDDYEDAFYYLEQMKHRGMIPLRGCYYKLVKTLSHSQDPRLQIALDDMKEYGYEISSHLDNYMLLKREEFEELQQLEPRLVELVKK